MCNHEFRGITAYIICSFFKTLAVNLFSEANNFSPILLRALLGTFCAFFFNFSQQFRSR